MEVAERDQLWASLRGLRDVIRHLAEGVSVSTEAERQVVALLARIVLAEIDFRERSLEPD